MLPREQVSGRQWATIVYWAASPHVGRGMGGPGSADKAEACMDETFTKVKFVW